jgi:hypothetical protein
MDKYCNLRITGLVPGCKVAVFPLINNYTDVDINNYTDVDCSNVLFLCRIYRWSVDINIPCQHTVVQLRVRCSIPGSRYLPFTMNIPLAGKSMEQSITLVRDPESSLIPNTSAPSAPSEFCNAIKDWCLERYRSSQIQCYNYSIAIKGVGTVECRPDKITVYSSKRGVARKTGLYWDDPQLFDRMSDILKRDLVEVIDG